MNLPRRPPASPAPLDTAKLTWAVLLGRWVEFAQSALALPENAPGRRLRAAVPDIIMLQAVWFALAELPHLPASEQALGRDRAAVLIERHAAALARRWAGEPLPAALQELIADAHQQLAQVTLPAAAPPPPAADA